MAKCNREFDSDDAPITSNQKTVFVDTNLDSHLALVVSDTDTVSDLKKKITSEHPKCFPNFGEIEILALKVKRRRYFYHLSDSMLVKNAFEEAKKSWFLSVDACSLKQPGNDQFFCKPGASNQLALLCITNTPDGDRNNHVSDSPSKRLSLLDTSLLPQPRSIQYLNQRAPSADQIGPGDSCEEVSKDLEMEVKHVSDDPCTNLFSNSKWSDIEMEKYDLQSEGNKVPEMIAEHNDGNSEVGVNDVPCNNKEEGSLLMGPGSKKKCRFKNKSEDAVSNCSLKDNNAMIVESDMFASHPVIVGPEFSSGNTGKEVLNDLEMENTDVHKEPSKTSFPDTNTRSDLGGILGTRVECRNDKAYNTNGDVQCNDSLVEASESRPATKKKQKKGKKRAENPSEENKNLLSHFSEEASKPKAIIPENSIEGRQKTTTATSDCLVTEPREDVHLVASSTSGTKKKKRKNKVPRDQEVTAEPSLMHNIQEESFKGNAEIIAKDSDKASEAATVPDQKGQHATLSETFRVSHKQKHPESVQEVVESNKLPLLKGIDVSGFDMTNAKSNSNDPEVDAGSGSEVRKNSKKHNSTNVKEFPLLAVNNSDSKKDLTCSGHENIIRETNHPDKIEEPRVLPQNRDPQEMLSEKPKPLIQGETEMHSKEEIASANLVETEKFFESGKSAGSKRMKKRANKSVVTKQVMPSMELADNSASGISSTAPHVTFNGHSNGEAKKEESILSQTERTKISKPKTFDTSFVGANRGSDDMSGNEAESLPLTQENRTQENAGNVDGNSRKKAKKNQSYDAKTFADFPVKEQAKQVEPLQLNQIHETQKNAEMVDEKLRKKIKKNQHTAANILPDLTFKEQEVGGEQFTSTNDRLTEMGTASKTKRKMKSVKTSSKNRLTGQELELEKNSGNDDPSSFHPQQTLRTVDSTHVPSSDTLEGNSMGRNPLCDVDGNALKNCNTSDANYPVEVSRSDGDSVNFKDYFVSESHKHEVAPVDKVSEVKGSDREVKVKKNPKRLLVPSSATSADVQNSVESYVNEGSERKSHVRNSSSIQRQESLLKNEHVGLHSKSSKVSDKGIKVPHPHDIEQIKTKPQETRQPDVVGSKTSSFVPAYPKENTESSGATSSRSGSPDKYLQNKKETKGQSSLGRRQVTASKASRKKLGEVVNSSPRVKSLLATPGAIFKDGSSESSEDENGAVNSDASTRTPSDNSSSSGFSEGESKSSLDLPRNGINGAKRKDSERSIVKSQVSGQQNITMDMILRSSKRFKNAKLTAESQLEDTESQPVDFVPDSQANL